MVTYELLSIREKLTRLKDLNKYRSATTGKMDDYVATLLGKINRITAHFPRKHISLGFIVDFRLFFSLFFHTVLIVPDKT